MEEANTQMAAMQAKFEETIAKLREDLTARLRVEKAANKTMREEAAKRKERSLGTSFDGQGGGNSADRRGCCFDYGSHLETWSEYRWWFGARFAVCSSKYCTRTPRGMPSLRIHRLGATF